jgi:rhodanese-related sulfurtransferase
MRKVYVTASVIIGLALFGFAFAVLSGGKPADRYTDGQPWERLTADQLQQAINAREPLVLVDLRQPEHYREGHIPGTINIPFKDIQTRYSQLPKDRMVVFIADDAALADASSQWLLQNDYKQVAVLAGGMAQWHGGIEK